MSGRCQDGCVRTLTAALRCLSMGREHAPAWLKRARTVAGYNTQASLARTLGVARATVGNWESTVVGGKPDVAIVPRLAQALGVGQGEVAERFGLVISGPIEAGEGGRMDRDVAEHLRALGEIQARQTDVLREVQADQGKLSEQILLGNAAQMRAITELAEALAAVARAVGALAGGGPTARDGEQ
jgi:transcriptional regulator with XRE-family HTH domain